MTLREQLNKIQSKYELACRCIEQEEKALTVAKSRIKATQQAQNLVQKVAASVQQAAHNRISSIVTRCLEKIFVDEGYTFKIDFKQKRGKTEAKLTLLQNGKVLDNPKDSSCCGVIDIAAFALRLACLMFSTPNKRKLLCLDEPFHFVNGQEYQERMGSLLLSLAKEMSCQIIMVADDDWLRIGKVIEL